VRGEHPACTICPYLLVAISNSTSTGETVGMDKLNKNQQATYYWNNMQPKMPINYNYVIFIKSIRHCSQFSHNEKNCKRTEWLVSHINTAWVTQQIPQNGI